MEIIKLTNDNRQLTIVNRNDYNLSTANCQTVNLNNIDKNTTTKK